MDMGCMQPSLPCAIKHFGTGLLETVQTVTAYFFPQFFFSKDVAVGKF